MDRAPQSRPAATPAKPSPGREYEGSCSAGREYEGGCSVLPAMEVTPLVRGARAPTILQLGPLYNNHLRRWSALARALGCTVYAAGHVRPGRRPVDLAGVADGVEFAPDGLYGLPPGPHLVWLRDLIATFDPDLIHAHWLLKWGYFSVLVADRPVLVTAWGSDFYLTNGPDRRRANYAMRYAGGVLVSRSTCGSG